VKRYKKKRRERYTFNVENIMGTANRNHCNMCLWSKHVDEHKGDRKASCQGGMQPIGLTFKHEGLGRIGEIMLIHLCSSCQKISINRTARNDMEDKILSVFERSFKLDNTVKARLKDEGILLLSKNDTPEVQAQLVGRIH
jgi:hypothetical protein